MYLSMVIIMRPYGGDNMHLVRALFPYDGDNMGVVRALWPNYGDNMHNLRSLMEELIWRNCYICPGMENTAEMVRASEKFNIGIFL